MRHDVYMLEMLMHLQPLVLDLLQEWLSLLFILVIHSQSANGRKHLKVVFVLLTMLLSIVKRGQLAFNVFPIAVRAGV